MRMLLKFQVPVEEGNLGVKNGGFDQLVNFFQDKFKPEAIYFLAQEGLRTAMIFVDMKEPSQMALMAEPWLQSMNAKLEMTPVMIPSDLQKVASELQSTIEKFSV
jgi:hypothetical protein